MQRKATLSSTMLVVLLGITISSFLFSRWTIVIGIYCSYILFKHSSLRIMFRGPRNRKQPLNHDNWELITADNDGYEVMGHINLQEKKSPLVIFIHGWESSSGRFLERMEIFRAKNCHTLALELRGHGLAHDTMEWTANKVISDIKVLLDTLDQSVISSVHFYGHSLGGFVTLGLQNKRNQGWWKEKIGTIILESPMTAYSPVIEQRSGLLYPLLPLLKRWLMQAFIRIHPEFRGSQWSAVDVPEWGIPSCPVLILQAENDSQLGRTHYDALMNCIGEIDYETHLITSLTHSKNEVNSVRDELISNWIDKRVN